MNACFDRIGAPGFKIGLDGDLAQSVEGHHVEIVHRSVVLGRIARTYHNPSVGNLMSPKSLELQKLQHRGIERLRHAVDLVKKKDSPVMPCFLAVIVNRCDDLAHRVLADVELLVAVALVHDERQAERALPCVVRHGIRHKPDAELSCHLSDHGCFPNAGCAEEEQGTLRFGRDEVGAGLIAGEVSLDGFLDLAFRFCDVHTGNSFRNGRPASRVAARRAPGCRYFCRAFLTARIRRLRP